MSNTNPKPRSFRLLIGRWLRLAAVAAATLWVGLAACTGPSNPEPILGQPEINVALVGMDEQGPDQVNLTGGPEAIRNANRLQVVNLDRGLVWDMDVLADGSFGLLVQGLEVERFRLMALDTGSQRYETVVITGDPGGQGVYVVPEVDQGCVRATPTHLGMGATPAGQPLYGEITVANDCDFPVMVQDVFVDNFRFTPVTLLMEAPLEPRTAGIVSVTFLSPGGNEQAVMTIMTDNPEPNQPLLIVTLRAAAIP